MNNKPNQNTSLMLPEEAVLRPHVTLASNDPLPVQIWLVAFGMLAFLFAVTTVAAAGMLIELGASGLWPWMLNLVLSTYTIVKLGAHFMPFLSGDRSSVQEIESNTEVAMQKTEKQADILARQLANEAQKELHRHTEEMQRIASETSAKLRALTDDVTDLRRGLVQYSTQLQRQEVAQLTDNGGWALGQRTMEPDQAAAFEWATSLYGADGKPDGKKVIVGRGGFLMGRMPWNGEGWPAGATTILTEGVNGWTPIIAKNATSANYKLNVNDYPTIQEVQNCLGVMRTEGWVGRG